MQFITVGEEEVKLLIPPPELVAELTVTVQLATIGGELELSIPPPYVEFPLVIVKPSSFVVEPTPLAVTTVPAPLPSMVVTLAPAPSTSTPFFKVIRS